MLVFPARAFGLVGSSEDVRHARGVSVTWVLLAVFLFINYHYYTTAIITIIIQYTNYLGYIFCVSANFIIISTILSVYFNYYRVALILIFVGGDGGGV